MTEKQIKEYHDYVKARIMCISFCMSQLTPDTTDVYKNDDENNEAIFKQIRNCTEDINMVVNYMQNAKKFGMEED